MAFWDSKTNITLQRIPDVAGPGVPLRDMIITPNEMLILGANSTSNNLFFLPINDRLVRKFTPLESVHTSGINRINMVSLVPMFLTLSGQN